MEMQQIRYFLALAATLNFTRAAENCNVTQPALTRAIQGLEAELGGALFHRERSRTHLSELGRMMLPYFESIRAQAEIAKDTAKSFARLDRANLTIGAMCTIGPALVSSLLMKFCEDHPEITVNVTDAGAKALVEKLSAGELELALFGMPGDLDIRFHGLPLFSERFMIVVPPAHRFARMNAVPTRELNGERYVNRTNCEYFEHVNNLLTEQGVSMDIVFRSERDGWVQGMIKAGMGLGFFPEFSVTDPDLLLRPVIEPEFARTIMLVTVRGRPHSPAVGAFIRQARQQKWPQMTAASTNAA